LIRCGKIEIISPRTFVDKTLLYQGISMACDSVQWKVKRALLL